MSPTCIMRDRGIPGWWVRRGDPLLIMRGGEQTAPLRERNRRHPLAQGASLPLTRSLDSFHTGEAFA